MTSEDTSASMDTKALDRRLVGGMFWTFTGKWASQFFTWGASLVVARLLSPDDYGLVNMATIFLGLITILTEFGLGASVVALKLSNEEIAQINTLSVLFGVLGFLATLGAAIPLGHFFRTPALPPVVMLLSGVFLISALRTVPAALLQKEMRYKRLSILEVVQSVTQVVTTLVCAWLGLRYWSLAIGSLVASVAATGLTVFWRRAGFLWPRRSSIGYAMRVSGHVLVTQTAWHSYSNADFMVVGRMLGPAALGFYNMAWDLSCSPIQKISGLVYRVTPGVFSAVQTDKAALRRYLRGLSESISLIMFPVTFGLGVVAPELIPLALGPKWIPAILPLQLLVAYSSFRALAAMLPQLLMVTGGTHHAMWYALRNLVVLPPCFFIASRWGNAGIAATWIVVAPLLAIPLYRRVFERLDMTVGMYLSAIVPAFLGASVMAGAVLLLKMVLPAWPLLTRLIIEVFAGAVVYLSILLLTSRQTLQRYWQLLLRFRQARSAAK